MTGTDKPAPLCMSPWVSPFPELWSEVEIWTATTNAEWCLKLFYIEDIHKVRAMWHRMRQHWVVLTKDAKIWPSALWFSAWLLHDLGIRAWKDGNINPAFPDSLQRMQEDWKRLDDFLKKKLEQQAAHDMKIGTEIEYRAFLLTSMLAIQASNIKHHMMTWTDSDEGDYRDLRDLEVAQIQIFRTDMNASVYREPLRPVSVPRINDWEPRPSRPLVTADRWAQMPFT